MSFDTAAGSPLRGATGTPPPAPSTGRRSGWSGLRPLVLRLHFYAGILVAPFLLVAATTGLLYAASFQIEKVVYADELRVPVAERTVPLAQQIEAAVAARPGGELVTVAPSAEDGATTRVLLDHPDVADDRQLAVFVDPYTGEVTGALESYGSSGALPVRAWISELHRSLHLGETGRLYSELAASWLWVVALGGLLLWAGRRRSVRGARGLLLPDRSSGGRRRTLSWHGAVGTWAVLGLVFLSATGLTWSAYAGGNIDALRNGLRGATPVLATTLDGGHRQHSGHGGDGGDGGHAEAGPADAPAGAGRVLETARNHGLTGPVEIAFPGKEAPAYVVKQTDKQWPVHLDEIAVHPETGAVVGELRFADHPLLAKLSRWGIDGHMGLLFGLANQIVLAVLMLGLVLLIVWGYRMWWQRRPDQESRRGIGRPMPRGAWRRVPLTVLLPLAAFTAVVGWLIPLLGLSLAGFLAVDLLRGAVVRRRVSG